MAIASIIALLDPAPPAAALTCQSDCGDCNADFRVTIDEILRCVNEAIGIAPHTCVACDVGRNGSVEVDDLISAVRVAVGESDVSLVRTTCSRPCQGDACAAAGQNGLLACGDGTVRVSRCPDDGACADVAVVESEGGEACFGICRFEPPLLEVLDEETGYRVLSFGQVGSLPDRRTAMQGGAAADVAGTLRISPSSEAVALLVEGQSIAAFGAAGLAELSEAVEHANAATNFADQDPGDAAALAVDVAEVDPVVQDALQCAADVVIRIGRIEAAPGTTATLPVTLCTGGADVAATQNNLHFSAPLRIAATPAGRPDCSANPDIDKGATSFAFQPPGCQPEVDCTAVRALVVSFGNTDPIPNRSVLYTCRVAVAPGASGTVPLTCSDSYYSPPSGETIEAACTGGAVEVVP